MNSTTRLILFPSPQSCHPLLLKQFIHLLVAVCIATGVTNVPDVRAAAPVLDTSPSTITLDPPAPAPVAPTVRLPDGARPTHYALTLTVVPGAARVDGGIVIDVVLDTPHAVLWLNADALNVTKATSEVLRP